MKVFSFGLLVLSAFIFFHGIQAQKNVRFGSSSGTSTGGSSATSGRSTTTGSSSTGGLTQQNVWYTPISESCNFQKIYVIPPNACVFDVYESGTYQIWSCDGTTASLCSSSLSDCSDCLSGSGNYTIYSLCNTSCHSVDQYPSQSPLPAPVGVSTYSDTSCNSASLQNTLYTLGFTQSSPSFSNYTFCNASGVFSGYCPTSNYSSNCTQTKSVSSSSLNICSKSSKRICGEPTVAKPTTAVSAGSFNSPFSSLVIVSVLISLSIWTWV